MKNALVTVVVPVYKTERYLDQCISAIVSQTYPNLEILLIDDGSPDRCPEICENWVKKDSRISVIHKQNEGLGMARNTGMEHASGNYICFVDSDDFIYPETIEKACRKAAEEAADVVAFGFSTITETGDTITAFTPEMELGVYRKEQIQQTFLPELIAPDPHGDGKRRLYMSACMMLYSMDLIRRTGWRFASEREIISEDVYSLLDLFQEVRCAAVIPEALYVYRTNVTSLSRIYRPNRYEKIRHFYLETMALCRKKEYSEDILHRVSDPFLGFTIAAMKQEACGPLPEKEKKENLKRIIEDGVLQQVLLQNRKDAVKPARRILFFVIRRRWYPLCRLLLNLQNRRGG